MATVTIYGPAMSTYVRTARMACVEKGVDHALEQVDFRAPEHLKLHPFGRVPVLRHGDFVVYETGAIGRYVDRAFPGPPLQPRGVEDLARMDQWLSAITDYVYQVMIRELVWERLVVPMGGGEPDEAKVAAALPKLGRQLAVIEAALARTPYLAGAAASLADLLLLPILVYVKATGEGRAALAEAKAVAAWYETMVARPSAAATDPSAA